MRMWYSQGKNVDYNGRCTCIWDQLNGIIPDPIIGIIDGYVHRGTDIQSEIKRALIDTGEHMAILDEKPWLSREKMWIFDGNIRGESFVNMGQRMDRTMISDPASRIVITANKSEIEIKINTGLVPVSEHIYSNNNRDLSWGYRWVTPFSRKRRHYLRPFVTNDLIQDATSGCMTTFDSVCDVAHDAISRWFHCDPEFGSDFTNQEASETFVTKSSNEHKNDGYDSCVFDDSAEGDEDDVARITALINKIMASESADSGGTMA